VADRFDDLQFHHLFGEQSQCPSTVSRRRFAQPQRDDLRFGLSIEFAGPVTAFARVECAIAPRFFTDFLTLVQLDGRWQIVSKVFHFDVVE